MNRRESLGLIGCFSLPILPAAALDLGGNNWLSLFEERWRNNQLYTMEVFEAMPSSKLNFQPAPEMMAYGKIFTHIGFGLDKYAERLDGKAIMNEPNSLDPKIIGDYLNDAFTHFNDALKAVKKSKLYTKDHAFPDVEPWNMFTISDIILLAYNHTIHHRAQATTYLRLSGINPPKYRF